MSDLLTTYDERNIKPALEALLLVSPDPVSANELSAVLGVELQVCKDALAELSADYDAGERGIVLREVAGGWRLYTHPAYSELIESYVLSWDTRKLSQAALETLAVVAYHQPVTRESVRAIRGVNSDGVISSLVDKGLVREVGKLKDHGQAIVYGTTQAFLEKFGLRSLKDLPNLEDFAPDEESRNFIRERLSARPVLQLQDEEDDSKQMSIDEAFDAEERAQEQLEYVKNTFESAEVAADEEIEGPASAIEGLLEDVFSEGEDEFEDEFEDFDELSEPDVEADTTEDESDGDE